MCDYVIGNYNCPQQIGNRLFVMLNAKLCARIYNKPLLWEPNTENGPFECDNYLKRNADIQTLDNSTTCKRSQWRYPFTEWTTFRYNHIPSQIKSLRSNVWKRYPNSILYCGRIERPLMHKDMPSTSNNIKSRIGHIFENGTFYAYGSAFYSLFQFKHILPRMTNITIGIHARNNLAGIRNSKSAFWFNVRNALNHLEITQPCNLFLASDEMKYSLKKIESFTPCKLYSIPRNVSTRDSVKRKTIDAGHNVYNELFMDEIQLLAVSQVFIGTYDSSSSELIMSLVAYNKGSGILCSKYTCSKYF